MRLTRSMGAIAGLAAALTFSSGLRPVSAHHSFGLYDMTRSLEIEGTASKFEWSNPHCWLFVKVASPTGAEVAYGFEMSSVCEVIRRGWTKHALNRGDRVKVQYHPLRDGRSAGYLMTATVDGKLIGRPLGGPVSPSPPPPPTADADTSTH